MNLEKLGVLFLVNYFNQLGTVKNHLLFALKEVLLAVQSTVTIFAEPLSHQLAGTRIDFLPSLLQQIRDVLDYTARKVGPSRNGTGYGESQADPRLKQHIVDSIISAINDEIEATRDTTDEKNRLKIEALHTVKQVLLNQKGPPPSGQTQSAAGSAQQSSRVA